MHAKLPQSCQTLSDPMDCSPPGSSVHEILQARILEWVAMPFSMEWTHDSPALAGSFFTISASWEAPSQGYGYWIVNKTRSIISQSRHYAETILGCFLSWSFFLLVSHQTFQVLPTFYIPALHHLKIVELRWTQPQLSKYRIWYAGLETWN